jgi:D-alanine-D-alanine ligase
MKIGITYDLKDERPPSSNLPDDFQEEFDSPGTISAIEAELRALGHGVVMLGDGRKMLEQILLNPPDFVFNIAEGEGVGRSREARVPAVLEMLGIPYTGSDPLTLSVTLDKECAKRLVASHGLTVPPGVLLHPDDKEMDPGAILLRYPLIVKPAWEGSSKGIRGKCVADKPEELRSIVPEMLRAYRQPILVEEYIEGDELTVGMVGNENPELVGIMRVVPVQPTGRFVYGVEVKRDYLKQVRYECPAPIGSAAAAVERAARQAFKILGCRDVARLDFRLRDGIPYFLEVNPLPGLNPVSGDLVIMARLVGWDYPRLLRTILQAALDRQGDCEN